MSSRQVASIDRITITPPNMLTLGVEIIGTAPLMINNFGEKQKAQIRDTQLAGSTAKGKKDRKPKDFDEALENARHISTEGWDGIHAGAFRNAMIRACKLVGFEMTKAKLAVFVVADGLDRGDGTPLVRIHGKMERSEMTVRLPNGTPDIRVRPMWREWTMRVNIRFDADQFTMSDIANLMSRVGHQVGVGEGRPFSKNSDGIGMGTFVVKEG